MFINYKFISVKYMRWHIYISQLPALNA